MNICFVGKFPFPDGFGATRRFYDIFGRLFERGHEVHLVNVQSERPDGLRDSLMRFEWSTERTKTDGVHVHRIDRQVTLFTQPFLTAASLVRLIRKHDIDVLILSVPEPYWGIPCVLAKLVTGVPLVIDYPDPSMVAYDSADLTAFGKTAGTIEEVIPRFADLTFPISRMLDEELLSDIPSERREILYPGVRVQKLSQGSVTPEFDQEGFVIGYMGTLTTIEGIRDLLLSIEQVISEYDDVTLMIAGGTLEDAADDLDPEISDIYERIEDHVVELGVIDHDDVPDFMASCDVLCAPQLDTHRHQLCFSTKVVEYLASGKPVVTTPIGDLEYVLDHEENVLFASPRSPDELADAFVRLHEDENLRESLGKAGLELAREQFDADKHRQFVEERLERLVAEAK